MPENDTLTTAFAEFRDEHLPQIRLAGLAPVRVKARRRHRARVAGLSLLALTMVAVALPVVTNWNLTGTARRETPAAPSVVRPVPDEPPCTSHDVIVQVTGNGMVASQPWVVISFINQSAGPCELIGYPVITAVNGYLSLEGPPLLDIAFTVSHGPLSSHMDPGRIPVIVRPGLGASFALGTETGDQDTYDLREVILTMPGDTNHLLVGLPSGTRASTPHGRAIPITVTGVAPGTAGPPQ
jgi:hypothetical protein